jgi:hypothetical protein
MYYTYMKKPLTQAQSLPLIPEAIMKKMIKEFRTKYPERSAKEVREKILEIHALANR